MYRYIVLVIILLFPILQGCDWRPRAGPPWAQKLLSQGPTNAPENFRQGWRDGCETGIATTGNHMQKFFYTFKQDSSLAQNPEYYTGWKNGWSYCQRYIFQYNKREFF